MIHIRMLFARTVRTLEGTLLACLLVLSVLMPSVDAYICIADAKTDTAFLADHAQHPNPEPADPDAGDAMCVNGHCHYWVGIARMAEPYSYAAAVFSVEPARTAYNTSPSAPPNELLRPPQV